MDIMYIVSQELMVKVMKKNKSPMFSQFISNIVKEFDDIVYSGREIKSFKSLYEYDEYFSDLSTDIHKLLFFLKIY